MRKENVIFLCSISTLHMITFSEWIDFTEFPTPIRGIQLFGEGCWMALPSIPHTVMLRLPAAVASTHDRQPAIWYTRCRCVFRIFVASHSQLSSIHTSFFKIIFFSRKQVLFCLQFEIDTEFFFMFSLLCQYFWGWLVLVSWRNFIWDVCTSSFHLSVISLPYRFPSSTLIQPHNLYSLRQSLTVGIHKKIHHFVHFELFLTPQPHHAFPFRYIIK